MNYSDMINRAFRTLRSGSLWGFMVTTQLAVVGLFLVAFAGGLLALGGASGFARLRALFTSSATVDPRAWTLLAPFFVLLTLAALLVIPLALIEAGGVIHLTDEFQTGRAASVGGAWGFGMRRIGRTFLVDFLVGIVASAVILVASIPAVLLIVASARNGGSNAAGVFSAVCGTGLLLLLMGFALFMLSGYEAVAIRYALIGDRTAADAVGVGWTAFRVRFKSVFLLLLILVGFAILFSIVQTAVNYFFQFAAVGPIALAMSLGGSGSTVGAYAALLAGLFFVLYAIALAMAIFMRIFQQALWTAFFRQMTGLEPPPQPVLRPAPVGTYYPPPQSPAYQAPYQPPAGSPPPGVTQPPAQSGYLAPVGYPVVPHEPGPPMAGSVLSVSAPAGAETDASVEHGDGPAADA